MENCCPVVELRDYHMRPGRRDELVALFEEHFVEGQERCGMRILGQFRNRRDPDRFVWMRGFPDMEARLRALEEFYGGPTWAAHRDAANQTMIDSSDVLLLRPGDGRGLSLVGERPGPDAPETQGGLLGAVIHPLRAEVDVDQARSLARALAEAAAPALGDGVFIGALVTERSANTFPRLPVREGENLLVWLASFPDLEAYQAARGRVRSAWTARLAPALRPHLAGDERVLELIPTRRSLLRHVARAQDAAPAMRTAR